MTRAEKVARARVCEGCGAALPPSRTRPRKWCSDNCRKRTYDRVHASRCRDCGTRTTKPNSRRCGPCAVTHQKRVHDVRMEALAWLYRQGHSTEVVAGVFGWTVEGTRVELTRARNEGFDVPYRNRGYGRERGAA